MRRSYFMSVLHVLRSLDSDKVLVLYEVNEERVIRQWHFEKVGTTWFLTKRFYDNQTFTPDQERFNFFQLQIYLCRHRATLQDCFKVYMKSLSQKRRELQGY